MVWCDVVCVCERADAIFYLVPLDEALGWSSREAAGERVETVWKGWAGAAGKLQDRGWRQVLQRGCRREGVLWRVQCAQWIVMLTLMLGEDLDVRTWVL